MRSDKISKLVAMLIVSIACNARPAAAQETPGFLPRLSCLVSCSQHFMTCMAPAVAEFSWCLPFSAVNTSFETCAVNYDRARVSCTRSNNPCLRGCEPRNIGL